MIRITFQSIFVLILFTCVFVSSERTHAQTQTAVSTTTLFISVCGDSLVSNGEDCDIPGATGLYSTTIAGRECSDSCLWGPYCGDAILQTLHGEQCDDGNNTEGDFCAADCSEETADSGGGSSGGGGNSGSGGSNSPLGNTEVTLQGKGYPNTTINVLQDGDSIGTVRTNSQGEFLFNTDTDPGTVSFSIWANDPTGLRSSTFTTTFDATQGAVTTVSGILLPPTIKLSATQANPGDDVTIQGYAAPNSSVEIQVGSNTKTLTTTAAANGSWNTLFETQGLSAASYNLKARYIDGTGALKRESTYGSVVQLALGVDGQPTSNADLNRDGKVNLTDFSILVFWWGTPGGNSNPPADINLNGRVSLEDFSILLFNWTG
jgi:cysteine-rich repeat protein